MTVETRFNRLNTKLENRWSWLKTPLPHLNSSEPRFQIRSADGVKAVTGVLTSVEMACFLLGVEKGLEIAGVKLSEL